MIVAAVDARALELGVVDGQAAGVSSKRPPILVSSSMIDLVRSVSFRRLASTL